MPLALGESEGGDPAETDELMTHFELPAKQLRQRVTEGGGSRGAGLAIAHRSG